MRCVDGPCPQQPQPPHRVKRDPQRFDGARAGQYLIQEDQAVACCIFENAGQPLGLLIEPPLAELLLLEAWEMRIDRIRRAQSGLTRRHV